MRLWPLVCLLGLCGGIPSGAQDLSRIPFVVAQPDSSVAVVDMDELFTGSDYGKAVQELVARERRNLAAENRALEAELEAEAADLAARRPELEPGAFRGLADAFDQKVQAIRQDRDARERQVEGLIELSEQRFGEIVTPLLSELMNERRALLLLDRRLVAAVDGSLDLTSDAIARVNSQLEDGRLTVPKLTEILPEADTGPAPPDAKPAP